MLNYIIAFPEEINGCGREDERFPSTMYGLVVVWACYLHDAQWGIALSEEDLEIANSDFRDNLDKIINKDSCCVLTKWFRGYRVRSYYNGVQYVGLPSEVRARGYKK